MNEDMNSLCELRDYREGDKSFVLATFLRGLYYGNEFFKLIPKHIFMDNYKHVAEALVSKNIIKVVCLKEETDVILGYSILSKDFQTIHWIFVKLAWRKKGVCKSMLPQFPVCYTHFTTIGKKLVEEKFKDAVFDPFNV